mmetsp:Transcript_114212/g.317939  ORF Transcript_114212/g.317939 Transcript_114212/m.317939 type:complete len:328 (-) Transcript_114212:18-1001(-)
MISSLARGARLVRQASVPATVFGAGYACCWAQGREETVPQLLVCTAAASWAGLTQGLRLLRQSLPEGAAWPRERLAKVETVELRALINMVAQCAERGLDSVPLRRIALRRVCQRAEADTRGVAVLGLVSLDDGNSGTVSTLAALAKQVDEAATALAAKGRVQGAGEHDLLLPLAGALQAIVVAGGTSWQEELGTAGVLRVAHAAMLASGWLATSLRPAVPAVSTAAVPAGPLEVSLRLSEEDEQAAVQSLSAVWQALGQPRVAGQLRSLPRNQRSPEAVRLHRELDECYAALEAPLLPSSALQLGGRPSQDFLPPKLRTRIVGIMRG